MQLAKRSLVIKNLKLVSESQNTSIYFKYEDLIEKERLYSLLLDIDCNFSKIFKELIPELIKASTKIKECDKNFKNFTWTINIEEKINAD